MQKNYKNIAKGVKKMKENDKVEISKEDEVMEELVDYIASLDDKDAEEFLDIQ